MSWLVDSTSYNSLYTAPVRSHVNIIYKLLFFLVSQVNSFVRFCERRPRFYTVCRYFLNIAEQKCSAKYDFDGVSSSANLRRKTETLASISRSSEGFVVHALLRPLQTCDDLWDGTVRANMTSCKLISFLLRARLFVICGLFLGFLPFSLFYCAYISCHYQKYWRVDLR